jgi:hypothetical protein
MHTLPYILHFAYYVALMLIYHRHISNVTKQFKHKDRNYFRFYFVKYSPNRKTFPTIAVGGAECELYMKHELRGNKFTQQAGVQVHNAGLNRNLLGNGHFRKKKNHRRPERLCVKTAK